MALHGSRLAGHRVGLGQVVGVGDPADAVGEGHVTVGEVGRRPAVDRRSDVLRGGDDDGEDDEQDDRVAVVQPVGQVVVVPRVRLDDLRRRLEDALEHHRRFCIGAAARRLDVDVLRLPHRHLPDSKFSRVESGYLTTLYSNEDCQRQDLSAVSPYKLKRNQG